MTIKFKHITQRIIMKLYSLSFVILLFSFLTACQGEDSLIADPDNTIASFLPPTDQTDAESELRRAFYADYGSFLLFSDTLAHRSLGFSPAGKEIFYTELIDISYTVGSDVPSNSNYTFTYLSNWNAKQLAVGMLKELILPHLGSQLRPFSILCVDSIHQMYYGEAASTKVASGERCVAIAMSCIEQMDSEAKNMYANGLMAEILAGALISKEQTEEFFEICRDKYDQLDFGYMWAEDAIFYSYEIGFLSKKKDANGEDWGSFCPSREQDLVSYLKLLFDNTDEQLNERFASYPLVKQKCTILRRLVQSMGFVS